jgi:hypothetical protein
MVLASELEWDSLIEVSNVHAFVCFRFHVHERRVEIQKGKIIIVELIKFNVSRKNRVE